VKLSRSRLLPAIAFLCLLAGSLEIYDPVVQTVARQTSEVLRAIEEQTDLPVTEWAKAAGFKTAKPKVHAGSLTSKGLAGVAAGAATGASLAAQTDPATEASTAITLKQIDFTGVTILGDMELKELVSRFIGVPMTYEQMLDIGMTVETYYRQNNYLARVIMPPQDLTEGKLMLEVIESVFSKIEVEEALVALPKTQEFVQALIQAQQPLGDVLNTKSLDRGLALANDVPGVNVQGALRQGQQLGETELLLKLYQGRTYQAEVTVDNGGSRSTGLDRLTASLTLFNPSDIGDLLSMVHVRTSGSDYSRLAYSVPVGFDGWRIGANASVMGYEVVVGEAGVKGAVGRAVTQGLELLYPLIREDNKSSTVTITADQKFFENRSAQGLLMSKYESDVLSAQIAGFMRDATPGGSTGTYSLQYSRGHLDLGSSANQQSDLVGANTAGVFSKIKLTYPTGEIPGSDAQLLTLELRHSLENGIKMAAFYDWGQVWLQHRADFPGAPGLNTFELTNGRSRIARLVAL
jgi:hemolysin activation/secretion protein